MRTLAVMHIAEAGGPPQHVRPWLAYLAEHGAVEVTAPRAGSVLDLYAPFARTSVLPYRPLTFPRTPLSLLGLIRRVASETMMFRRHIRETRPDVVLVVTSVVPAAVAAARLEGVPVIVYVGEILRRRFPHTRARATAGWVTLKLTAQAASGLICCSKAVARQFDDLTSRAVIAIAYPGIKPEELVGDRKRLRQAHGFEDAAPCVAVVGNIARGRGHDLVIRALPEIRRAFPDAHCLFAGQRLHHPDDIAYYDELRRLVAELQLGDAVSFVGFVGTIGDVYESADIIINPARVEEGFGRVAVEALAAGKPVIATRVGAIPEILTDGEHALLVEPDRPDVISAAVRRLWADRELRTRLVRQGRAHVVANFTERTGTEAFAHLVEEVFERERKRGAGPNA